MFTKTFLFNSIILFVTASVTVLDFPLINEKLTISFCLVGTYLPIYKGKIVSNFLIRKNFTFCAL